jgi:hypothetical protein
VKDYYFGGVSAGSVVSVPAILMACFKSITYARCFPFLSNT